MAHSKIDLRVVELEEEGGIYCPFVCDGSVRCAHVQQNYDVMKINYMCQCNRDRPAPQDTKLPDYEGGLKCPACGDELEIIYHKHFEDGFWICFVCGYKEVA